MTMTNNGEFIMPRFRLALAAGAILLGAVGAASAADLPGPAPMPPPQAPATYVPVAPVFSWTGFYLGANAGYAWSTGSGTFFSPAANSFAASGSAFEAGGQLGYNYQFGGGFVLGAEGDFQGSFGSGATVTSAALVGSANAKVPWFGTLRGRVGYAFDRLMIYGTGGAVFGDGTLSGPAFSGSSTYWTWTVGAGAEYAFAGPWSAKVEYLYAGTPSSIPLPPGVTSVSGSASTNLIRAGLNYHF
jgi:outer membrane immunogenic protein